MADYRELFLAISDLATAATALIAAWMTFRLWKAAEAIARLREQLPSEPATAAQRARPDASACTPSESEAR